MCGRVQPEFGRRLRALRLEAGLTQTELAAEGLTQSYLSHLESGRREPTVATAERLAARLNVPLRRLTGEPEDTAAEVLALLGRAELSAARGDDDAPSLFRQVLAGTSLASADGWLRPHLALAELHERDGDLDQAVRLLELALPRATQEVVEVLNGPTDPLRLSAYARLSTTLSRCYREAGDLSQAVDVAASAAARLGTVRPRPIGYAQLVATLASAHSDRGDLLKASHLLNDLLQDAEASRDIAAQAAAHWNAALVAAERGLTADALRLIDRASWLVDQDQDQRSLARVRIAQAWLLLAQPAPDARRAKRLLVDALPDLQRHATKTDLASAHTELARAELALGAPEQAALYAETAVGLLSDQPNLESVRADAVHGQALIAIGRPEEGRARLDRSARALSGFGSTREAAVLWRLLAETYASMGLAQEALSAFGYAMDTLGVVGEMTSSDPLLTTRAAQFQGVASCSAER